MMEMTITMDEFVARLPKDRQEKIEASAQKLKVEYLALQGLRKAKHLTQQQMAAMLGVDQGNISRLEKRSDLMISTLLRYIEAMGGELSIIAKFPDLPPIEVTGFAKEDNETLRN